MPPLDDKGKKFLHDILEAISHIENFTSGFSFNEYENDLLVRRAVERELEIIGEAMNKLLILSPTIEIRHARRIVDLRNRVIHGYDKVDNGVIWGVIKKHLPNLNQEVAGILEMS